MHRWIDFLGGQHCYWPFIAQSLEKELDLWFVVLEWTTFLVIRAYQINTIHLKPILMFHSLFDQHSIYHCSLKDHVYKLFHTSFHFEGVKAKVI